MPTLNGLVSSLPAPLHRLVIKHSELIKFALVGGTTFIFDMIVYFSLIFTVLDAKPVIAKIISGVLATIMSYILNSEWAFKHRGGRERAHEAALFFIISGIGVVLAALPLWVANNVFDMRAELGRLEIIVADFALGFVIGNLMQMAFRFWALRKFAFPEPVTGGEGGSTDLNPTSDELIDEELGHA